MDSTSKVTRREFTAASALAMLSGVTITIGGCGGDADSPTAPTTTDGGATGVVGSNHGHTATITAVQLISASVVSLDITGTADHPHVVSLTAAEVQQISAGTRVSTTSTVDAGRACARPGWRFPQPASASGVDCTAGTFAPGPTAPT